MSFRVSPCFTEQPKISLDDLTQLPPLPKTENDMKDVGEQLQIADENDAEEQID